VGIEQQDIIIPGVAGQQILAEAMVWVMDTFQQSLFARLPRWKRDYLEAVVRNLEEELKAVRAQIEKLQSKPI